MAGVLDVALAGPRMYHGTLTDDSFVHRLGRRDANHTDIERAVKAMNRSWFLHFGIIVLLGLLTVALF